MKDGMALKIRRSRTTSTMGKPIFILDARMDVSRELYAHIHHYGLEGEVIYESSTRKKHNEAALAHLEASRMKTSLRAPVQAQMKGIGWMFWAIGRAVFSSLRAAFALRVTISSLMRGVHLHSKDMTEILDAEEAFTKAGKNLRSYLEVAATFTGREQLIAIE